MLEEPHSPFPIPYSPNHPFSPPLWLRSGDGQTLWGPLMRRVRGARMRVWRVETPDGDFLRLHVQEGRAGAPVVLLLHGLEGCARSHYVAGMMERLGEIGWTGVAMEFRGCGGVLNRAPRLYHSGETGDVAHAAEAVLDRFRPDRFFAVGFSLGGNVLLKWLGETGSANPLDGAAAVCPPFDLTASALCIDRHWGGFYARHFMGSLVPKAIAKGRQHPGLIDAGRVRACTSIIDYDTAVTAAVHGFRDAWAYYDACSCGRFLEGIRVPTLLIAAEDDPMNPAETLPRRVAETLPWLVPLFTRHGGHLGYRAADGTYWAERRVADFLQML